MSDAEYFADDAIDQTALKKYLISPKAYAQYVTGEHQSSPVLEFGKAAHSLILGSGPTVLVKPNRRTKEGRAEWEKLTGEHAGEDVVWVSPDDHTALQAMRSECSYFSTLPGKPEMALFADDQITGLALKGKADWLPTDPDVDGVYRIRDYKTTVKSPVDFTKSAWMYGYHIQAAFYMRLYRATGYTGPLGFEFVVQEKNPPYDWMLWRLDEDAPEIDVANQQINLALKGISWFREHMDDPLDAMASYGLDHNPQPIRFPDWKLLDLEEEIDSWR
nr:PD-(D/E)XK nuclease-like domain-containing protein [Bifidobacterium sp. DSM 109959]